MKKWRGMTAERFYELRDARTSLQVASDARQSARIRLSIDDEEAQTFAGQLCFLSLVNMSSRWCRNISLEAPSIKVDPRLQVMFGGADLQNAARGCGQVADPFGTFMFADEGKYSAHIHVGADSPPGAFQVIGRGWIAFAGSEVAAASGNDSNPLGAILAACIGACQALRLAIGDQDVAQKACLSLWNFGAGDEADQGPDMVQADLGRLAVIGVGAIGAAIAYYMPLLSVSPSHIALVDKDTVEIPNLNRVPVFFADDVAQGKSVIVSAYLKRFGIDAISIPEWFNGDVVDLGEYDLVVAGANERNVQPLMMANCPPLLIGASTGSAWDAYFQRHIPLVEDCLECRIPTMDGTPVKLHCSSGDITPVTASGEPQTGALPFLSVAAALMALAEIQKLGTETYPLNENFSMISFRNPEFFFMTQQLSPRPRCSYCWRDRVFRRLRAASRYFHLSCPRV